MMKLGLMSLGDIVDDPVSGTRFSASERYRMTIESAGAADRLGLHGIYIGEHHGIGYTFSTPPVLLAAIAERTTRLRLGTAVALAANLDPLRLAEDYATVDVLSGGRVDLVTGRGNFFEKTYDLFGQSVADSADRFAEAMELLCTLWPGNPVEWQGRFRPPIDGQRLQPAPIQTERPPFWIGGGSSRDTAELTGRLGLGLMLPSAFGKPDKFVAVADIYREAFARAGHAHAPRVGGCWHGWVGATDAEAHARFMPRYHAYHAFTQATIRSVNDNPPPYLNAPFDYGFLSSQGPAIVGGPEAFAERLLMLSELVGTDLNIIKMDMGGVPRPEYLDMVERLGSEVMPLLGAGVALADL
jgi:alkanesulfonate monooxygenase SsuD/methylene tetrahydromethanopterin reductase-like flavin-dependent oxidoreductase (luciferase family)